MTSPPKILNLGSHESETETYDIVSPSIRQLVDYVLTSESESDTLEDYFQETTTPAATARTESASTAAPTTTEGSVSREEYNKLCQEVMDLRRDMTVQYNEMYGMLCSQMTQQYNSMYSNVYSQVYNELIKTMDAGSSNTTGVPTTSQTGKDKKKKIIPQRRSTTDPTLSI